MDISNYKPNRWIYYYWSVRRFLDFRSYARSIKYFYQRGRRGYSDQDAWNIDYYLVKILIPMLRRLKDKGVGYPGDLSYEEWHRKINIMLEGFKAAEDIQEDRWDITKYPESYKEKVEIFDKGMKEFHEYFFNLWD